MHRFAALLAGFAIFGTSFARELKTGPWDGTAKFDEATVSFVKLLGQDKEQLAQLKDASR
jgi:hypothetical protein